ncbi:MAG: elongation factor G [Phycisphaerales bacterium]|nr:elongation factor G [Phycisphaerales bacterium]
MKPENIRNIAFVGHTGAGKTSLAEACLLEAGLLKRLGAITDGTCALDFTAEEKEKQCSLQAAICTFNRGDTQINLIDTPGSPDFCGQAIPALGAVETAVLVVSATAGVEVNTRKMFERAKGYGLAVMFVVNKIDGENVNLPEVVESIQSSFGAMCLPVNLPTNNGKGVIDVMTGSGEPDFGDVGAARTAAIEAIVGADDALMERYLGGDVAEAEAAKFAPKAVARGELMPIVFTASRTAVGIGEFLNTVTSLCPSPVAGKQRVLVTEDGANEEIQPDPAGALVGLVFKVGSDDRTHIKYALVRIFHGTLKSDVTICTLKERKGMRPGQLHRMSGAEQKDMQEAVAGDIVALAKLDVHVGDVVFTKTGGRIATVPMPTPMFSLAINPKARGDEDKIGSAFKRYMEEDPCFILEYHAATHESVIRGIGDLHLRTMLQRLVSHYKVEVETRPPRIPYRETITGSARDVEYTHKKQTGGSGQYGKVVINLHPKPRGEGYEFVDKIFGGAIDGPFRVSVDKGIQAQLHDGVLAGYPIVDVQVELTDGKTHAVDSKDIAFQIAGRGAFREAFMKAKPVFLEPIVNVEVTAPMANLGDLQGDMASRRGRVEGQEMLPGQMAMLHGKVPLSEMSDYHSRLSSVSGGQGSFVMELSHYEQVPSNVQQRIIDEHQKAKAAESGH